MATKGMMVSSRSNDSALARKGMLSSNAASKVRRATPVTDRCQPRSAFTRRARPPLPQASHSCPRGDGVSPRSAVARSRRGRWAPLLLRPPRCRAARPARPPSRPRGRVIRAACATAWSGTPRPARARTGSRAPPPDPGPAETARTPRPARSLAGIYIIRRGYRYRTWLGVRLQRRLDEAVGDRACARDTELLEQERRVLLEVGRDRAAAVGGQIPHAPLERPDRLLAALVVELLFGVPLLPLVLALRLHPLLELAPQVGRQLRVVEHDVLEIGREVDLDRFALGEAAERLGRQRRSPVLHRAAQAVLAAGVGGQGLEGVAVQLHRGDRAVGEHDTAVARARLYGDLADARVGPPLPARGRAAQAVPGRLGLLPVRVLDPH